MNTLQKIYILTLVIFTQLTFLQAQVTDDDVKVAYINRFTEFIEWKESQKLKSFAIGIFDDDEVILNKFNYLAQSRKIKGKKIEIIPIQSIEQLKDEDFQILYVSRKQNENIASIFTFIKGKNTLLVTDNSQTKEAVMINFLPSEKEGIVRFEVNKKNVNDEGLIIHPDILLLGGTYIDVRKLFQEKEEELEIEKDKLRKSKLEVQKQNKIIQLQDKTIGEKEHIINNQNKKIDIQKSELEKQKKELDYLTREIRQKQVLINNKLKVLNQQETQIKEQQNSILSTKTQLKNQKQKLENQENQIALQEDVLIEQLSRIEFQRNILFIFLIIIILVLSLVYFIYRSFKIKKRSNVQLKKYNEEILTQNEEILSQREEIIAARDKLEIINSELEKLSIVASKTNNAVIIANSNAEIEWINDGFTRLFGYKYEELIHKFGKNLISISSHSIIEKKLDECRKSKTTVEYLAHNTTKNGEKLWMHTSLTPILDENGTIKKLIVIEANVNDIKNAEENIKKQKEEIEKQNIELEKYRNHLENLVEKGAEQLLKAKEKAEESDRLKSSFISNMSHEIRTPMNAVLGFSRLLVLPDLSPEKLNEYVAIINSNANSLIRLIDDIIDLSDIEAGRLLIKKSDCDVNSILDELLMVYKEKIKIDNPDIVLRLYKELENKKFIIYTDKLRVNQLLINLLDNALKFTSNGKVEFGYTIKNEKSVLFFVKDTGIGIEPNKQKVIFDRFFKIESDNKKLYRGTGLGLSICKSIVNELKGNIGVESEPGKGSKFFFTIPIVKNYQNKKQTTTS